MGEHLRQMRKRDVDRFNEVWGDKEPQAILDAIRLTREVTEKDLLISTLAYRLGERFLIVPGMNEIATEQLATLMNGYMANREGWNAILDGQS